MLYRPFDNDSNSRRGLNFYESGMDEAMKNSVNFHVLFNREHSPLLGETERSIYGSKSGLGEEAVNDRQRYFKNVTKDAILNNSIDIYEEAARALARNSFTAFNRDIYRITTSGTNAVKRILGGFNLLNSSNSDDTLDRKREEYDKYSSSVIYRYLFRHETVPVGSKQLYSGLSILKEGKDTLPSNYNTDEFGGDADGIAMGRWTLNNILRAEEVNVTTNVSKFHQELIRTDRDILINRMKGVFHDPSEDVRQLSDKFLSDNDYLSKPGIKAALTFIESAREEITIDLFQLQNKAINDVLVDKLRREKDRIKRGEFKFNLRLASPVPVKERGNMIGYKILGPNIIIMERLYNLQQEILNELKEGAIEGTDLSTQMAQRSEARRAVMDNFQLQFVGGKYHPKLFTTEKYAMLGSFNLTSPVGNSPFQSGSNYEEIMILHNRLGIDRKTTLSQFNKNDNITGLANINPNELDDEALRKYKEIVDTHLFMQAREIARLDIEDRASTVLGNQIGLAGDIGQGLRTTLRYLTQPSIPVGKRRELYMNLNQVWLLQYDNDLYYGNLGDYAGEFGPSGQGPTSLDELSGKDIYSRGGIYRNEIQKSLFDLLSEGRAFVSVDTRTYRTKVLNPMYKKIHYLLGAKELANRGITDFTKEQAITKGTYILNTQFEGNLEGLTRSVGYDSEAIKTILGLGLNGINSKRKRENLIDTYGQNLELSRAISEDANKTVSQLLAITRGNIIQSTETMQHVKNAFAVERDIDNETYRVLATINGSSNFGRSSLAFSRYTDTSKTSTEVGAIYLAKDVRDLGEGTSASREARDLTQFHKASLASKGIHKPIKGEESLLYRSNEALNKEAEDMLAQMKGKTSFREWKRLTGTQVGQVDTSGRATSAIWESRVNQQGLTEMVARLDKLNRDIGYTSGIKYEWIHGAKGERIGLEIAVDVGAMAGFGQGFEAVLGSGPKHRFKVTNLQGGLSNEAGFVYLIDQNKVLGQSLFVNATQEELKGLPYGEVERRGKFGEKIKERSLELNSDTGEYEFNELSLAPGESLRLNPIDNFLNILSTLGAETAYRTFIRGPREYITALHDKGRLGGAGLGYLEYLLRGQRSIDSKGSKQFLRDITPTETYDLIRSFQSRHMNDNLPRPFRKALELQGSRSIHQYKDMTLGVDNPFSTMRGIVVESLRNIAEYNRQIKSLGVDISNRHNIKQIIEKRERQIEIISKEFERHLTQPDSEVYQIDLALGLLESRQDILYQMNLSEQIKGVKAGLLEPFITQGQASTYSAAQAWFRTPLYGIHQKQESFLRALQSGTDKSAIGTARAFYKYALGQGFTYGPVDSTGIGTEGDIRSVAEGGSISQGVEDEGLSMYGLNKTPVGDITRVEFSIYSGIGSVTSRKAYNQYLSNLHEQLGLVEPSTSKDKLEAIDQRVMSMETNPLRNEETKEALSYVFNVSKKASQIPQRLKNVLGSRALPEVNPEVSYLMRTKGDVTTHIDSKLLNLKVGLMSRLVESRFKGDNQLMEAMNVIKSSIQDNNYRLEDMGQLIDVISHTIGGKDIEVIRHKLGVVSSIVDTDITPEMSLAIINNSGFRSLMNSNMIHIVEEAKRELSDKYGFKYDPESINPEDNEFIDKDSLARFMVLAKARIADTMTGGVKGFTSTRDKFRQVSLIQLGGAYSDYFYANPLYGSDRKTTQKYLNYGWDSLNSQEKMKIGTMSTFFEKSEKRQKSSMMAENFEIGNRLLARKGDIVTFDSDTNRVLVWGNTSQMEDYASPKHIINMEEVNKTDKSQLLKAIVGEDRVGIDNNGSYYIKDVVDSRDQVSAIAGVIDNFRTIDDLPNISSLDRKAWHRNAEESIEYIVSGKQLTGFADNNQLLFEFIYARAMQAGGGRRIESTTGLGKGVMNFTSLSQNYNLGDADNKLDFFSYLLEQLKRQNVGDANNIQVEQIFGLLNPSNLKSHFYSHGSEIIRDKQLLERVIGNLDSNNQVKEFQGKKLAASLLLAFGNDWIGDNTYKTQISNALFQNAISNDLGTWFRNMAITSVMQSDKLGDLDSMIKSHNPNLSVSSLSGVLDKDSDTFDTPWARDIRDKLGSIVGDSLVKKAKEAFNPIQTPSLAYIDPEYLLAALGRKLDDENKLNQISIEDSKVGINYLERFIKNRLYDQFYKGQGLIGRDFLEIDDIAQKEASLLAAGIDLISQLSNQNDLIDIPTDIPYEDDRVILQLASIGNFGDMSRLDRASNLKKGIEQGDIEDITLNYIDREDLEYLEVVRAQIKGLTKAVPVISLYTDFAASQSKEPIGSKSTGGLEHQHLIKPLMQNVKSFQQEGELAGMRKILANMLAIVGEGETLTTIESDLDESWLRKNVYDIADLQLASTAHKSKFLGLYATKDAEAAAQFEGIKSGYQEYEKLVKEVSRILSESIVDLDNRDKRIETISMIEDLNLLSPESREDRRYYNQLTGQFEDISEHQRLKDIFSHVSRLDANSKDINQRANSVIDKLSIGQMIDIARSYQLDADKPFGVGSVEPILDAMSSKQGGYQGFAFYLPNIEFIGGDETNMEVSLDYSSKRFSYLLGADQLKAIGDQYGSFVDPLVAQTIYLASAFTPGTSLSRIREKMTRARSSGNNRMKLTKQELVEFKRFYQTANKITEQMAIQSSNARAQSAWGGKTRLPGSVTTPVASWLVPPGHMLLAEEAIKRYGTHALSTNRYNMFVKSQEQLGALDSRRDLDGPSKTILRNYYESMSSALLHGMSEKGTKLLNKLPEDINLTKNKLNQIVSDIEQSLGGTDYDNVLDKLSNVESFISDIDNLIYNYKNAIPMTDDNKGDRYATVVGETELRRIKNELINRVGKVSYKKGKLSTTEKREVKRLKLALSRSKDNKKLKDKLETIERKQDRKRYFLKHGNAKLAFDTQEDLINYYKNHYGKKAWTNSISQYDSLDRELRSTLSFKGGLLGEGSLLDEELERNLRGKSKPFVFSDEFSLGKDQEFSNARERREYMSFALNEMKRGFQSVTYELDNRASDTFRLRPLQKDILSKTREPLDNLISIIDILEKGLSNNLALEDIETLDRYFKDKAIPGIDSSSKRSILDIKTLFGLSKRKDLNKGNRRTIRLGLNTAETILNTAMNSFSIEDTLEVFGFRSPPFGGSEAQRQSLSVIHGISLVNQYAREDIGNQEAIQFSEDRNKALSILSPLSLLTMNLGDFDGDPHTTIFSGLMDITKENEKISTKIRFKEYKIGQLKKTSNNKESIIKLNHQIKSLKQKRAENTQRVALMNSELSKSSFTRATKKEVANYLGVDMRHFLSTEEGGYTLDGTDMDVMFTFIEQGAGLFGGMENVGKEMENLHSTMKGLFLSDIDSNILDSKGLINQDSDTINLFKLLENTTDTVKVNEVFTEHLEKLSSSPNSKIRNTALSLMVIGDEAREHLIGELKSSLKDISPINEKNKRGDDMSEELLGHVTSTFFARYQGLPGLQKVISQGGGVNMELPTYDMMVKVMGKAGGDVLGKTYNTLVTTLYSDTPVMALGHVLNQDYVKNSFTNFIDNSNIHLSGVDDLSSTLLEEIDRYSSQAEGLQSFMKSINQLLRDGIKPKGGKDLLDRLREQANRYEDADPKQREKLITNMAAEFGPSGSSVGMSAFMELNTLINERSKLLDASIMVNPNSDDSILTSQLRDMDSVEEIVKNGLMMNSDEFDKLAREISRDRGKETITAFDVAASKVSRDIRSLVIAYRYNVSTGASEYEKGERLTYMDTIWSGSKGKYGITDDTQLDQHIRSRLSDDTNIDILSRIFGVTPEEVRTNYIDNTSLSKERAVMLEIVEESIGFTKGFFGKKGFEGEKLARFTSKQGVRQDSVSTLSGRNGEIDISLDELMGADLWESVNNLAASGKLNQKGTAAFWSVFSKRAGLFENGADSELLRQALSGITTDDNGKLMPNDWSPIDGERNLEVKVALYKLLDPSNKKEFRTTLNGEERIYGKEGKRNGFMEFLKSQLEATATSIRAEATSEFIAAINSNMGDSFGEPQAFISSIIDRNKLIDEEARKNLGKNSSKQDWNTAKQNASVTVNRRISQLEKQYSAAKAEYQKALLERNNGKTDIMPRPYTNLSGGLVEAYNQRMVQNAEANANRINNVQDIMIPAALSLLGSAVLGGRLNEEMVGDVVGGSLIAASYMKGPIRSASILGKTPHMGKTKRVATAITGNLAGHGFKFNMALQETEGDIGEAVALQIGRDVGFHVGSMIAAPLVERGVTNILMSGANLARAQRQFHDLASVNKLDYRTKMKYLTTSGGALDIDEYSKVKGTASTISSAVLSGVLGIATAGVGGRMASSLHNTGEVNDFALIDQAIKILQMSKQNTQTREAERQTNPTIQDVEGNIVVPDEITPIEEIQYEAIRDNYMTPQEIHSLYEMGANINELIFNPQS